MFGLINRGQLTSFVANEFENLTARLKALWLTEHNEDGTHGDIVPSSVTLQGAPLGTYVDIDLSQDLFFTLGSGVWTVTTGDVTYFRAMRFGQLVFVQFRLDGTALSVDTEADLYIRLYDYHVKALVTSTGSNVEQFGGMCRWYDRQAGTEGQGEISVIAQDAGAGLPASTVIELFCLNTDNTFKNWAISNDLDITGFCWFITEPDNVAVPFWS